MSAIQPLNELSVQDNYLYLDRAGHMHHEQKGVTCWLGRFLCQLCGIRDYRLHRVVLVCLKETHHSAQQKEILLQKAFLQKRCTPGKDSRLAQLALGRQIEINSSDPLIQYNRLICRNEKWLCRVFRATGNSVALDDFKKVTYKLYRYKAIAADKDQYGNTLLNRIQRAIKCNVYDGLVGDWYILDELEKIGRLLDKNCRILSLAADDPMCALLEKAAIVCESVRSAYADERFDADVLCYDLPDIQTLKLWSYTGIEKWVLSRNGNVGHVAVEVRTPSGVTVSHMMEKYTQTDRMLQHLSLRRFRLNLQKLLTPKALAACVQKLEGSGLELDKWLRDKWQQVSGDHIASEQSTLLEAKNSALNQIIAPFRVTLPWRRTNHRTLKPYQHAMLCSEYVQMSITNRLNLLERVLREELNLVCDETVLEIPLDSQQHDRVLPGKMLERWKAVLIPVDRLRGGIPEMIARCVRRRHFSARPRWVPDMACSLQDTGALQSLA